MANLNVQTILIALLISSLLFLMSIFFMENISNEVSETAFECGFEPFFLSRIPFSVHFFTVTVVFLIFDLEVVVLIPILFSLYSFWPMLSFTVMVWMLLAGLLVEWFDSSIAWQL